MHGLGIGTEAYVGRARVAHDAIEALETVEPGDIIVTPYTAPTYNAVLAMAGGLVTEEGGLLCHAAVIARELGLPAVIGAADAMSAIPDGATIEVDPVAGEVRLVSVNYRGTAGNRGPPSCRRDVVASHEGAVGAVDDHRASDDEVVVERNAAGHADAEHRGVDGHRVDELDLPLVVVATVAVARRHRHRRCLRRHRGRRAAARPSTVADSIASIDSFSLLNRTPVTRADTRPVFRSGKEKVIVSPCR